MKNLTLGNRKLIAAFVFMFVGAALAWQGKLDEVSSNFLILVYLSFVGGNSVERYTESIKARFQNGNNNEN